MVEGSVKDEIRDFLKKELKETKLNHSVVSLILYGSIQKDEANKTSDVDIAVVVGKTADVKRVSDIFVSLISRY